jgi:hypothetical protein
VDNKKKSKQIAEGNILKMIFSVSPFVNTESKSLKAPV